MLELKHLRLLCEVVDRGSLSGAADAIGYSQPAVSQQIGLLERRVGVPLLDRTPRGVRPTEAGRVLVDHAERILAGVGLAEAELAAIAQGEAGRLRVAAFPTAGAGLMPPAMAHFMARYPKVEVSVIESEPEDAIPGLHAGELDLALVAERRTGASPFGALYDGIDVRPLLDEPMCVLLPKGHKLARARRLRLKQVEDERWIGLSRRSRAGARIHLAPAEAGFDPNVAFQSDDVNVVQGMVAVGAGIAILPELAISAARADIVVRALADLPGRTVAAARLADRYQSPVSDAFIEALTSAARHRPD